MRVALSPERMAERLQIIAAAAKLLKVDINICADDIDWALEQIELVRQGQLLNKPMREKVSLLRDKLKAGLDAFNALPPHIRQAIEPLEFRELQMTSPMKFAIMRCDAILAEPKAKGRNNREQLLAAALAKLLLEKYKLPISTTKTGYWVQLSSLLFCGSIDIDLSHQCRKIASA